jgi:ABC-2 type transport system ATP-binding protein
VATERADRLLRLTDLTGARDRQAQFLSGGMKQKLALACALIHEPALLLLDEPTNGVDPIARREFWRLLTELLLTGVTIVISTSYLDEAEWCNQVGCLADGRLLITGAPTDLRALVRDTRLEVRGSARAASQIARRLPGVVDVTVVGDRLQVVFAPHVGPAEGSATLTTGLATAGLIVTAPRAIAPTLEAAVIMLTRAAASERARP